MEMDAHFPKKRRGRHVWIAAFAIFSGAALLQAGCTPLATMMHAVGVDRIPAEYEGLKNSTVAVITLTDSSQYANDVSSRELSRFVGEILTKEVRGIQLVREDKIEQWRDVNGWDSLDFDTIGKGVGARKSLELNWRTFAFVTVRPCTAVAPTSSST